MGLLLGLTVAYRASQRSPPSADPAPSAQPQPKSEKPPEAVAAIPLAESSPDAASAQNEPRADAAAADAPTEAPPPETVTTALVELKAEIATLEKKLIDARDGLGAQTAPLHPPENLPERFTEKAIVQALTAALKETGSAAQLSSVDCTEYPCIAYFDSLTQKDLDALKRSSAYAAYSHDRFTTLGRSGPEGPYDALVAMPRDDTNPRNDVSERIRFRMGQMLP